MTTRSLLRAAGLVMWAFVGVPAAYHVVRDPEGVSHASLAIWFGAFLVFGATFFRATGGEGSATTRLLFVQTLAALVMNTVLCTGFEVALLVVVAVQLGLVLPVRSALVWLVVQSVLLFALATHHMGMAHGSYWSIAAIGLEAFAFTLATMAGRETAARRALERTNAELETTRESLARASRDAERLRIARELHDLLGHDLIALHLELETARHVAEGRAKDRIERAHDVAKTLLADLRSAVSKLREEPKSIDVAGVVRAIFAKVKSPRVHFDAPASLFVEDAEREGAIVRFCQEVVTNAIKHAAAENLWITLAAGASSVELTARDDGKGTAAATPGHGLVGMRERFERLGGEVVVESGNGEGFRVRARLPVGAVEAS
jgi:signal transduction histidine kinase